MRNGYRIAHRGFAAALAVALASTLLAMSNARCPWCGPPVSMVESRATHTATKLPNGLVLIVGGMHRDGDYSTSAELYDSRTRLFAATGSMPTPRGGHTATLLRNGKVLITGGYSGAPGTLTSALLYDPETAKFTRTGSMTVARGSHSATLLPNGRVLVAGGEDNDIATPTAEIYDPATGRFSPTG